MKAALAPGELIVDNFAGGGGASLGIEWALGRSPDIAVNHDPEAVAMHAANHPSTHHYCESVWNVDPIAACGGKPVGLAWFSPDCKHFSKAKGGKPVEKKIRGLAWIVVKWARLVRPRVIILENVEEFQTWGPLTDAGKPCPVRKGRTFRRWVSRLRTAGYEVEMRELKACDYGAPTTRKRLFIIARCDGQPIVWPEPTHGPGLLPYRTAAECIEWSIPCRSIFERKKPLAENTQRRIARGLQKFGPGGPKPFIIGAGGPAYSGKPVPIDRPFGTLTTENHRALVIPALIQTGYGERKGQKPRSLGLDKPLGTVVAGGVKHALVAAWVAKHNAGNEAVGQQLDIPLHTVTAKDTKALVTSQIVKFKGTSRDGQSVNEPLHTVQAGGNHYAEVRAFCVKFYGHGWGHELLEPLHTITAKDRFALVVIAGELYAIADIGMRMFIARELYRAQGFDDWYVIDPVYNGKPLSHTAQVRMCGNSVCPDLAEVLVIAQFAVAQQVFA